MSYLIGLMGSLVMGPLRVGALALTIATLADGLTTTSPPHVVIVGGGFAGFGAAEGLSRLVESGELKVSLLEANKRTGGLAAGWTTPKGRPVEAGIHGKC